MMMTTDPGDLVLDPTCGSGTTAYVAEQWGRRWITIDTSRVAVAIARQRLLTAKFDYYKPQNPDDVGAGFFYKSVPHVTLKSIAQNMHLDPIFAKHEPLLTKALEACNGALKKVTDDIRFTLLGKLKAKEKSEGKRSITDADRRRWELPKGRIGNPSHEQSGDVGRISNPSKETGRIGNPSYEVKEGRIGNPSYDGAWQHWQVPFDTDPEWPKELRDAVTAYRKAWRAKMDDVNQCIADNAEHEELVDQPEVERDTVRVSGPFSVEAVQPPEMTLGDVIDFAGAPTDLEGAFRPMREAHVGDSAANVAAYLDRMVRLLRGDGVGFPNNKRNKFTRLDPIYANGNAHGFHAEGNWEATNGRTDWKSVQDGAVQDGTDWKSVLQAPDVGVVFGPQYGPVTAKMIENLIKPAARRYDHLVVAGFNFTAEAQALIEENPHPKLRIHIAHIRPDANPAMADLLKEQPGSQLFTVFGQPRTLLKGPNADGEYTVEMEGVDIYNPVDNSITPTKADKVAAWFIDGDYDEQTFCVTQAFFPDRSAWDKLAKALGDKGLIDAERFAAFAGTESLPFKAGEHKRVAVKVIDPRGNEVMRVHEM